MSLTLAPVRRAVTAALVAGALTVSGLVAVGPAAADTVPAEGTAPTVSADALPTAQIDGVVWQQAIAAGKVWVGGEFGTARPAGAAAGTSTVVRRNLLAYNLTTGVLDASFAPNANAQIRAVAASPDGTRVYVGGNFTTIAGQTRNRIAAFDTATGALVASFNPGTNSQVRALVATNTTVYAGGIFTSAGGQARTRLAAFSAANGAVLPWNPSADNGSVSALTLSPDGTQVVVGGNFTTFNGSGNPGYGLARVDATTGASLSFGANTLIRNGAADASITSLSSDASGVYGTGYVFGSTGNLEGTFRASWETGEIVWVEDCHGDTYAAWPASDVVYTAGHAHYCGNVGGFPQTDPWSFYRAIAFTKAVTGTLTRDPYGYFNYEGTPAPTLVHWFPEINTGSYTGQGQGPWTVTGNDDYVVYAGEFTIVNNVRQQGLVRFARSAIAPNKQGPRVAGANFVPSAVSLAAGTVRLAWQSNFDRDNADLVYEVVRNGTTIHTFTASSAEWRRPQLGFVDTGLVPGATYTYRLRAKDPFGTTATGNTVSVTVAATGTVSAYAQGVLADGATSYWRLGEPSGTTVYDWAGFSDATAGDGVTRGATGAVLADTNTASTFSGASGASAAPTTAQTAPDTFTSETWIRTTSTSGGKILGFGNTATGLSGSYDRHVYMDGAGRIWFGVYPGGVRTVNSSASFNDGEWHHVVAQLGATGMRLYVDGKRVGQRTDTTSGQAYSGVWRIGGDNLGGWPNQPSSAYFAGDVDEVAIYPSVLTQDQVLAHYTASGRTSTVPSAPADAYGAAVYSASPELFWRLGESAGTTASDSGVNGNPGAYVSGVQLGAAGALVGVGNTAATFDGASGLLASSAQFANPTTYSEELWFSTTTTNGGKLIGFGSSATGTSGSYDRHVYMENDGRLTFGTWTGQTNTITSPTGYNDGAWHHLVATQSSVGMRLYLDGALVASGSQPGAQDYTGYWRVGGDTTWGPQPWFAGTIDEVAVYSSALTAEQVAQHHALGATGAPLNQAPVATFTQVVTDLGVELDASGSTDADGTVASYAWDLGDGELATGATASHTYATEGTYTVTLTVTDDDGATGTVQQDVVVTAPPPNQAPVAVFTLAADGLGVTVDGSGSTDADGTLASYAWSFGDAGTATGATASHTYAAAGTYTVTLTVTDDDGATGSTEQQVTATAPPANQAPVAVFTQAATGLDVTVDGTGSTDADGTVASYAWDFGDGGTATGAGASHTYAAAGTYPVTLTVTDDDGATGSVLQEVVVTAPPVDEAFAADAFGRAVAGAWGPADTGGTWATSGSAAAFSVADGVGSMRATGAGWKLGAYLQGLGRTDTEVQVAAALDVMPTGGGTDLEVAARTLDAAQGYRLRLKLLATGVVRASLISVAGGTTTTLSQVNVPGLTYTAGTTLQVRVQATGTAPTALRAKVWVSGTAEPAAWTVQATDANAALQVPGGVGLQIYTSASTTGLPVTARFSGLRAVPAAP
jgi:PKD repeat protein